MPISSDNRHALLCWDAERAALVTQEFAPGLTLELRLPGLVMQFREDGRPAPHVFEFDDRTPAEAEAWVLVELLHRRLDRDRFSKLLPYEFCDLMTGDAVPYVVEPLQTGLEELATWFTNAALVLGRLAEEHSSADTNVLNVSCWPESFHVAVLLNGNDAGARSRETLRVGWSAGDDEQSAPYFYVSPHHRGVPAEKNPAGAWTARDLAASDDPSISALAGLRAEITKRRGGT